MSVSTTVILRLEMDKNAATFGEIVNAISQASGDVVAIDVISSGKHMTTRDITVNVSDSSYQHVVDSVKSLSHVRLINVSDSIFLAHLGGKISVEPKARIKNRSDLSKVYTPGVARVCKAIEENPKKAFSLTIKRNTVAVVTDGTAVLGLGNIGPLAAIPVMEGKAMLFKQLAGVDAFPICLDTQDTEQLIQAIKQLAPIFGGINLEDISAPRCFEIEKRLSAELDIPVFHDDQHGTAVVVLAGLINALKVVGKSITDIKIVVNGIGSAGSACCKMLLAAGVQHLVAVDRYGALNPQESYDNPMWQWLSEQQQLHYVAGGLLEAIDNADVFIGVSQPGVLTVEHIEKMATEAIVFAMANPEPEIEPDIAEPLVRVIATGRSDYPNQINNVLCFPGIFRGALDCRAATINEEMKLAAAVAIASVVTDDERSEQYIIPSIFNESVVDKVRDAVIKAAIETKVARRIPLEYRLDRSEQKKG
ncbi:malate dehydrogenase (oxaloacetate-decarboxylating) [Paenibacillus endophyticus]|uniref:Malate dehydrogenase (Oxaloacetate-decarboxylating) n=1 Tax=Paenibacillus endophyticus TaxID=1294268 RepID=A0A7W5CDX0_9BACL|nr:NAD-dependent malic enzyme [Paenibacillus endophyticus]MBB3155912.1 malate dehydrogenase (oxaloacetate-decarboxylating) [Paenibacillus endophyticus]